jgi:2-amino-4-hydroxy-6-hydroxymethyldihydropteridine diphosphokinase
VATLRAAARRLEALGSGMRRSRLYRTAPVGGPAGQPDYLNAVVSLAPAPPWSEPARLLAELHAIERTFGRRRRVRWEARLLDLDLIALGERVLDGPDLVVPHPRAMERPFVLVPLLEVAPAWRDPRSGRRAADALADLDASGVRPSGASWTEG